MNEIWVPPLHTQVRVTTTTRLSHTSHLLLRDGLPWTVILFLENSLYTESAPLWDKLRPAELAAWLGPWGVPLGANPWDHIDPTRRVSRADIPPSHRLPADMEERILAMV